MAMTTKQGSPVTEDKLDEWAEAFEQGSWPDGKTVHVGRPRLAVEEVKSVTFRLSASKITALDEQAHKRGVTRSKVVRDAVDKYLMLDSQTSNARRSSILE